MCIYQDTFTNAMCISWLKLNDTDKRIVLLTKDYGRIPVFVNNANHYNDMTLGCQPFTYGTYQIRKQKNSFALKSFDCIKNFYSVVTDFEKYCCACYFSETINDDTKDYLVEPDKLKLLLFSMLALEKGEIPPRLIRCIFFIKLLQLNGLTPSIDTCIRCGSSNQLMYYNFNTHGCMCPECASLTSDSTVNCSSTVIHTLYYIYSHSIEHLFSFKLTQPYINELEFIINQMEEKPNRSLDVYTKSCSERSFIYV